MQVFIALKRIGLGYRGCDTSPKKRWRLLVLLFYRGKKTLWPCWMVLDAYQPSCRHVQMESPELALEKGAEKEIMYRIRRGKKNREGHLHSSHLKAAKCQSPRRCGVRTGHKETWCSLFSPVLSLAHSLKLPFTSLDTCLLEGRPSHLSCIYFPHPRITKTSFLL